MSTSVSSDTEWVAGLPHFEGLFEHRVSSILPSFVRLAIPFFCTSSASPIGSIKYLTDLTDIEHGDSLDIGKLEKAFVSFQVYIIQARMTLAKEQADTAKHDELKEHLCEGYLRGFYLACLGRQTKELEVDYLRVAKDCLVGLRVLVPHLSTTALRSLERNMVSTIFADSTSSSNRSLAVLFRQTRSLTERLLGYHLQRPGQKGSTGGKPGVDPVRANEDDAVALSSLTDEFVSLVRCFERLSGTDRPLPKQTKKAVKEREEQDQRRPGRIILEALLAKCELSMVLASLDMAEIKARAVRCHPTPVKGVATDADQQSVASIESSESGDSEGDVKPVVSSCAEDEEGEEKQDQLSLAVDDVSAGVTEWEDRAEECLLECLRHVTAVIKSRQSRTLREAVRPSNWLDEGAFHHRHGVEEKEDDASSEETSYADSDSGTDTDDSDPPGETDATGPARPAPLRAIFRLQDRYEELRLAVWLCLPAEIRGKMSAFMRGIPTASQEKALRASGLGEEEVIGRRTGLVGRAWDQMGLALLKDFDPDTLSDLGLDLEKLDKWQDLASAAGAKKTKKARKTI